ncbi:hypothetical protein [Paraburkholderia megapolitana]|uniref:hypothetical protein n=1 Tax=Paraburkholderia megapolitana TaxID=420953 RepID=UPI000B84B078|nr:hypothetical protein [Paraburkholderia megapolitana]QDQ80631.1 hypothetical protein FNZ07_05300 [Paraburkholderia megapolitana]
MDPNRVRREVANPESGLRDSLMRRSPRTMRLQNIDPRLGLLFAVILADSLPEIESGNGIISNLISIE